MSIESADNYITSYCLDIDDWMIADDTRKQRFLNVAERALVEQYVDLIIPDEAVFEFTNALMIVFNDTNRLQKHGINSFSIVGLGSFDFKAAGIKEQGDINLLDYLPKHAVKLINKANNIESVEQKLKWTGI
jgi:hypothetical protein